MNTDAVKFQMGQIVYRKTDPLVMGVVTAIVYRPNGHSYYCRFADFSDEVNLFEVELTAEKDYKAVCD